MATNYQKGYNLEYRTKKKLEECGWLTIRSPGSKSPIDMMAMKNGHGLLVQCKKTTAAEAMYIKNLDELIDMSKKHKARPVLVYSFLRSPLYAKDIKEARIPLHRLEKHVELEKYLKIIEMEDDDSSMIMQ